MKNLNHSILGLGIACVTIFAVSTANAAPFEFRFPIIRPPVIMLPPVIPPPAPAPLTAAQEESNRVADAADDRRSQAYSDLNSLRTAAMAELDAASASGAGFDQLVKIVKKYDKAMSKVTKVALKDIKKIGKQGAKSVKKLGGTSDDLTSLQASIDETCGDLQNRYVDRMSELAQEVENLLDP